MGLYSLSIPSRIVCAVFLSLSHASCISTVALFESPNKGASVVASRRKPIADGTVSASVVVSGRELILDGNVSALPNLGGAMITCRGRGGIWWAPAVM